MHPKDVRLLFMGASIISGWKTTANALWTLLLEPRGALNIGIPGETSGQLLWRVQNGFLRGFSPDITVLQVGANDRELPAEHVAENIGDIVRTCLAQMPTTRMILFGIFPTDRAGSPLRRKNDATNALLRALDAPRVCVVECGGMFLDASLEVVPELLPDGLHLSALAYERWSTVLLPLLDG